jgi:hypothetical protein
VCVCVRAGLRHWYAAGAGGEPGAAGLGRRAGGGAGEARMRVMMMMIMVMIMGDMMRMRMVMDDDDNLYDAEDAEDDIDADVFNLPFHPGAGSVGAGWSGRAGGDGVGGGRAGHPGHHPADQLRHAPQPTAQHRR